MLKLVKCKSQIFLDIGWSLIAWIFSSPTLMSFAVNYFFFLEFGLKLDCIQNWDQQEIY